MPGEVHKNRMVTQGLVGVKIWILKDRGRADTNCEEIPRTGKVMNKGLWTRRKMTSSRNYMLYKNLIKISIFTNIMQNIFNVYD